jgi:hypothetical protein
MTDGGCEWLTGVVARYRHCEERSDVAIFVQVE